MSDSVVVRNIYYMMAYSFKALDLEEYAKLALEEFELHPSARVVPRSVEGEVPDFLPQLLTDVTLRGPEPTLIIDCKCYGKILLTHHGKSIASPAHVNQIFAYVMHEAQATKRPVLGMLLYALTDAEEERTDTWRDLGHDFYLWTLDLAQPFDAIEARLKSIAKLVVAAE